MDAVWEDIPRGAASSQGGWADEME